MAQPATRSLGRLSEIAQVMVRHGFGYFLEAHKLTDLLPGRSAGTRLAAAGANGSSARGEHLRELLAWAKEEDVPEVSLNFCALTEFISPERAVTLPRRLLRRALLAGDRVFQLERLHSFNRKFFPEWRPRYICVEKISDLPVVGLAYLRVEQLLTPPRPFARKRVVA